MSIGAALFDISRVTQPLSPSTTFSVRGVEKRFRWNRILPATAGTHDYSFGG